MIKGEKVGKHKACLERQAEQLTQSKRRQRKLNKKGGSKIAKGLSIRLSKHFVFYFAESKKEH